MTYNHFLRLSLFCLFLLTATYPASAQSGHQIHTGIDILSGDRTTSVRFRVVNGYRFTPKFSAGIGAGFTYYDDPLSLLPIFINMKYRPWQTQIAPFVFLGTGYTFSILTDTNRSFDSHRGGFMLNPGIGLRFETQSNFGWYLNAGYNLDHSNLEREGFNGRIVETDISYRRLMFGMGLSF